MAATTCDERTVSELKSQLTYIYKVVEKYRWIIEAYVSDFYVKSHWTRLPLSWQQYLGQLDFSQLSCLLTGEPWCHTTEHCSVSPLSLMALKACCKHLILNRRCVDVDSAQVVACVTQTLHNRSTSNAMEIKKTTFKCPEGGMDNALGFKNGQLMEMEHIFRKHVKPKKQHEIRQLGKVIHLVSEQAGSHHVVDVGAGLGHLSRLLTFSYGLKVTTVEATGGHAPKASEFDRELKKDIQKKLKKNDTTSQQGNTAQAALDDLPHHVVCTVQPDITTEEFLRLISNRDFDTDKTEKETELAHNTQTLPVTDTTLSMEWEGMGEFKACLSDSDFQSSVSRHCKSAAAPHNTGQSTEVPAAAVSCDEAAKSDSLTVSQCSGASAAKVSKYDSEEGGSHTIGRDLLPSVTSSPANLCCGSVATSNSQNTETIESSSVCEGSVELSESKAGESLPENRHQRSCGTSNNSENLGNGCQTNQKRSQRDIHDKTDSAKSVRESSANQTRSSCDEDGPGEKSLGLVLAGLHACGDLTATLLRVFVNCPAVSALVSVACCYMKLSAASSDDDTHSERGYPMSQFVHSLDAHPLTYEAREMACHFADAYAQRLKDHPPHLKIHSYRAALQYVVTRTRPDFRHGLTRLVVKKGAEIPFRQYAIQCLRRLGIDPAEVSDDVMTTAESLTVEWREVVAFYTLRLSLAPLVETAVLLDRMLFLYEQGLPSVLMPVFDSALSPRNFALLACKPRSGHHL